MIAHLYAAFARRLARFIMGAVILLVLALLVVIYVIDWIVKVGDDT